MSTAMDSMSGIANVHHPPALCKETTCTINSVLYQWKSYMDPHVHPHSSFDQSSVMCTLPHPYQRKTSFFMLTGLANFFRVSIFYKKNPTNPLFSAKYFQDCIVNNLYLHTPVLGSFVNQATPHITLDNLFVLVVAVVAAAMHDYQEGKCNWCELTSLLWCPDYHRVQVLIQQIQADEGESLCLDRLQQWMLAQRHVEMNEPV